MDTVDKFNKGNDYSLHPVTIAEWDGFIRFINLSDSPKEFDELLLLH